MQIKIIIRNGELMAISRSQETCSDVFTLIMTFIYSHLYTFLSLFFIQRTTILLNWPLKEYTSSVEYMINVRKLSSIDRIRHLSIQTSSSKARGYFFCWRHLFRNKKITWKRLHVIYYRYYNSEYLINKIWMSRVKCDLKWVGGTRGRVFMSHIVF